MKEQIKVMKWTLKYKIKLLSSSNEFSKKTLPHQKKRTPPKRG